MSFLLKNKLEGESPATPKVTFGKHPHETTEHKLVGHYKWLNNGIISTRVIVLNKYQFWELICFIHGIAGASRTITFKEVTGVTDSTKQRVASKMGIKSDDLQAKISYYCQREVNLRKEYCKDVSFKVPPQLHDWYWAKWQLIEVFEISDIDLAIPYWIQRSDFFLINSWEKLIRKALVKASTIQNQTKFRIPTMIFHESIDPPIKF